MSRPSPTEHAADLAIDTIRKGNDGFYYKVTKRSKSLYWRKLIYIPQLPKLKKAPHTVAVGEIVLMEISPKRKFGEMILPISKEFLEVLRKKPKYISRPDGNAYVFGKFYGKEYYYVGYHGNDVANTGILDITGLKEFSTDYDRWLRIIYPDKRKIARWDVPGLLKQFREISPRILFVGNTDGGDVGAGLYVHATNGVIDSLIIDNNVFT